MTTRKLEDWWDDAHRAAPRLIGSEVVRVVRGQTRRGRIVETEAYTEDDPASHSYRGQTPRNLAMFGPPGRAYVYRIHQVCCFNIVAGPPGRGEAVLVRALEPLEGTESMARARARASTGRRPPSGLEVTNGPGKLCQALGITQRQDGWSLIPGSEGTEASGLFLRIRPPVEAISRTGRIGVSQAWELQLRFIETDNPWVSPGRPRLR